MKEVMRREEGRGKGRKQRRKVEVKGKMRR